MLHLFGVVASVDKWNGKLFYDNIEIHIHENVHYYMELKVSTLRAHHKIVP